MLTLLSAPSGYGKTTAMSKGVEEAGQPVARVTPEHSDTDVKQFLTYSLTALGQAEDDLGQEAPEIIENTRKIYLQRIFGSGKTEQRENIDASLN